MIDSNIKKVFSNTNNVEKYLDNLHTDDKSSLLNAINELTEKINTLNEQINLLSEQVNYKEV